MAEPRKPTITTSGIDPQISRVLEPVKQSIEMLTGGRSNVKELVGLQADVKLEDVIRKVNEIVARLNASGTDHV